MPYLTPELRPAPQADTLSEGVRLAMALGALETIRATIAHPYRRIPRPYGRLPEKEKKVSQRDLIAAVDELAESVLRRIK